VSDVIIVLNNPDGSSRECSPEELGMNEDDPSFCGYSCHVCTKRDLLSNWCSDNHIEYEFTHWDKEDRRKLHYSWRLGRYK
jgi:hypothetical protein